MSRFLVVHDRHTSGSRRIRQQYTNKQLPPFQYLELQSILRNLEASSCCFPKATPENITSHCFQRIRRCKNVPSRFLQKHRWPFQSTMATVTMRRKLWCWKCAADLATCRRKLWLGRYRWEWRPGARSALSTWDSWSSSLVPSELRGWQGTSARWRWRCGRSALWLHASWQPRRQSRRNRSRFGLRTGIGWLVIWKENKNVQFSKCMTFY